MQTKPRPLNQLTPFDFVMAELQNLRGDVQNLRQETREAKREIKETRQELNGRMDRLEGRMDRIEERLDRLDTKIESERNETKAMVRHSQIMTGSSVAIALGVLYYIATH